MVFVVRMEGASGRANRWRSRRLVASARWVVDEKHCILWWFVGLLKSVLDERKDDVFTRRWICSDEDILTLWIGVEVDDEYARLFFVVWNEFRASCRDPIKLALLSHCNARGSARLRRSPYYQSTQMKRHRGHLAEYRWSSWNLVKCGSWALVILVSTVFLCFDGRIGPDCYDIQTVEHLFQPSHVKQS